jgi:hypothetical protein
MAEVTLIRHILRLLTAEEVEELTTVTEVEDMHSLTDLAKEYLCSFYIDPIVHKMELAATPSGPSPAETTFSQETAPKTIADFIFQEKEKFKKFNQQSKKQESMEIYRHTLQHGISIKNANAEQDGSIASGTGKGALVNRKVG